MLIRRRNDFPSLISSVMVQIFNQNSGQDAPGTVRTPCIPQGPKDGRRPGAVHSMVLALLDMQAEDSCLMATGDREA